MRGGAANPVRLRYTKRGKIRWISHRDVARALERAFPKLALWERGEQQPTLRQLEQFARRTHAPVGYFFLAAPPDETLPIPDFRTFRNEAV